MLVAKKNFLVQASKSKSRTRGKSTTMLQIVVQKKLLSEAITHSHGLADLRHENTVRRSDSKTKRLRSNLVGDDDGVGSGKAVCSRRVSIPCLCSCCCINLCNNMLSRVSQFVARKAIMQPAFRPMGVALFSTDVVPGIGKGKTSTGIVGTLMIDCIQKLRND